MLMGWRKVFRMGETVRDFSVMERIGRVYVLPGEISDLVSRFEDLDPQLYLGWREELEEAFLNLSFRSEFNTFVTRIPRTLIVNIEFCANALSERCPEPMVETEKLAEINKLAAELLTSVQESDLNAEGKRYFLDYLNLIRRAVQNYPFDGAPALQSVIDSVTGSLATQRQVSIPTRETPIGKKFWGLASRITKALAPPAEEEDANRNVSKASLKVVDRRRAA